MCRKNDTANDWGTCRFEGGQGADPIDVLLPAERAQSPPAAIVVTAVSGGLTGAEIELATSTNAAEDGVLPVAMAQHSQRRSTRSPPRVAVSTIHPLPASYIVPPRSVPYLPTIRLALLPASH